MKAIWSKLIALLPVLLLTQCSSLPGKWGLTLELTPVEKPNKTTQWKKVSDGRWEGASSPPPVLINGNPLDASKWPQILWIRSGGASCTASLVGPRVLLTAAHCAKDGATIQFGYNGTAYSAKASHHPEYNSADHDIALAVIDKAPPIKPFSVILEQRARMNMELSLFGFGCVKPGGGGGNDGVLRGGKSLVVGANRRDLVAKGGEPPSALCFGDSGGPVLAPDGRQIGVNSKGNIRDTNYLSRTDRWAKGFFESFAKKNNVEICGLHSCEGGGDKPDPKPQPPEKGEHIIEDAEYRVIILKKK